MFICEGRSFVVPAFFKGELQKNLCFQNSYNDTRRKYIWRTPYNIYHVKCPCSKHILIRVHIYIRATSMILRCIQQKLNQSSFALDIWQPWGDYWGVQYLTHVVPGRCIVDRDIMRYQCATWPASRESCAKSDNHDWYTCWPSQCVWLKENKSKWSHYSSIQINLRHVADSALIRTHSYEN